MYLGWTPLWVDEAESAINAFSILEQGYPGDRYLGIPVFENMLVRPWPEHPEYEFKDISYSDRGMAVYHAWLPLYAIALSFKVFGVEPPAPTPGWQVKVDVPEFTRRTVIARLPSLLFSAAFLVLLAAAGRGLAGEDAALAVLVLAGLSSSLVEVTIQARYYALLLALHAAGGLTLWRAVNEDRLRDHVLHVAVLVGLFYTHVVGAANLALVTAILVIAVGTQQTVRRSYLGLLVLAASAAPWLLWTGYLEHLQHVPTGRGLLAFPDDLLKYLSNRVPYLALFASGACWLALARLRHGQMLPARLREPWQRHSRQYSMLLIWMSVATATYYFLLPPASQFPQRLSLSLFVPGLMFMAMSLADAARIMVSSRSVLLAPLLAAVFLAVSGVLRVPPPTADAFDGLRDTLLMLNRLHLRPDAKVYASPSTQLVLSFYAEKPIQSLAPIRKRFLDTYPGEVLYIEGQLTWEFAFPGRQDVQLAAQQLGQPLSDEAVRSVLSRLRTRFARERTRPLVDDVEPPLEALSPLAEAVMVQTRNHASALALEEESYWESHSFAFARGFRIRTGADLWQTFFYRLVDPRARSGERLNAAARLRHGRAYFVSRADRVFFYSPSPVSTVPAS